MGKKNDIYEIFKTSLMLEKEEVKKEVEKLALHLENVERYLSLRYHPLIALFIQNNNATEELRDFRFFLNISEEEYNKKPFEILIDISFKGENRPYKSLSSYSNGKTLKECVENAIHNTRIENLLKTQEEK